jgi:hypothetical protein
MAPSQGYSLQGCLAPTDKHLIGTFCFLEIIFSNSGERLLSTVFKWYPVLSRLRKEEELITPFKRLKLSTNTQMEEALRA